MKVHVYVVIKVKYAPQSACKSGKIKVSKFQESRTEKQTEAQAEPKFSCDYINMVHANSHLMNQTHSFNKTTYEQKKNESINR